MERYQLLIRALVCTILFAAAPSVASAQLPGPAGSMSANPARTVNLSWPLVTGTTWYYIWVTDSSGVPRYQKWHTASELKCGAAQTTTCAITVPVYLLPGTTTWWVQTWNASGYGPWSSAHYFETPGPLFAVVSADGVLTRGNAASAGTYSSVDYWVQFHRDVTGCVFNVNLGSTAGGYPGPGFATSATAPNDPKSVIVTTYNSAAPPAFERRSFHLSVVCD